MPELSLSGLQASSSHSAANPFQPKIGFSKFVFYTDSLQQHGGIQWIQQSGGVGGCGTWAGLELFQRMTLKDRSSSLSVLSAETAGLSGFVWCWGSIQVLYAWTASTVLSEVHSQALKVLFKLQFSTFTDESKKVNNDKNFRKFITFIRDVDTLPI